MIEAGQPAPDFTLPDEDGNPVKLSDLKGNPVVLYFYPKADTLGSDNSMARCGPCPNAGRRGQADRRKM
jgi:peroxiredoxin